MMQRPCRVPFKSNCHYDAAMRVLLLPLLLLLLAAPPAAAAAETGTPEDETARAAEIMDGDTLVLEDGRQVRLVGIQAPKLPLGRPNFETWPLAEEAKEALAALALGRSLRLAYGGRRMDRHGRLLAHLYADSGAGAERWVQGALLEQGLARVYSFADNRALIAEMLALERAARAGRRGIWTNPFYAIREAEAAGAHLGSFQLVEGRVLEAAVVRGRAYLNFGADWREDFTVTLAPKVRRRFEVEGIDPRDYQGTRLRVRGWLKSYNGPMIEVTHPEQIEVLQP
jgi:endonuclease YncB( thermonuclease family)